MEVPQDRYLQMGQFNTRYWAEGDQGSTVILLHGVGGFMEHWLPSFVTLATQQ